MSEASNALRDVAGLLREDIKERYGDELPPIPPAPGPASPPLWTWMVPLLSVATAVAAFPFLFDVRLPSYAEVKELRASLVATQEKLRLLESRAQEASSSLAEAESRLHKLEGKKVYGALPEEEKRFKTIEAAIARLEQTGKTLSASSEEAQKTLQRLDVGLASLRKTAEATVVAAEARTQKKVDDISAKLNALSLAVERPGAKQVEAPQLSGNEKGIAHLPPRDRIAVEGGRLTAITLEDSRYKISASFPLAPLTEWIVNGKAYPDAQTHQLRGTFEANLTIRFGKVIRAELKQIGKGGER